MDFENFFKEIFFKKIFKKEKLFIFGLLICNFFLNLKVLYLVKKKDFLSFNNYKFFFNFIIFFIKLFFNNIFLCLEMIFKFMLIFINRLKNNLI